jgi:tetratricopeptide (TPR) repeat protein
MKWLLLLALGACASGESSKKTGNQADPAAGVVLTNKDFSRQKPLTYSREQDFYPTPKEAGPQSALMNESAGPNVNLVKKVAAGKDPLITMMSSCYAKEFEAAFKVAESIYDTHQSLPTYWNQVATCYLIQGNERKALLFYNKALEVTPNYVPALNNIGVMYEKSGQDQKALVALQRALKNGRFTKTPRFNLGHLYLSYNLADEALPLFKGLADEAPQDADVRAGLANSLAQLGRWQEAWDEFQKVTGKIRSRPDVGLNMALCAHRLGKIEEASAAFRATDVDDENQRYAEQVRALIGE